MSAADPDHRASSRRRISILVASVLLLATMVTSAGGVRSPPRILGSGVVAADGSVTLDVAATGSLSFVPDQLTVAPGQLVHLVVTQEAAFDHTFTLSPVANFQFATSSSPGDLYTFFHTHTAIVNLSLGSNPGAKSFANFTAPAAGSYEFLCLIPTHFQSGMHGTMVSQNGTSGSSSPFLSTSVLVGILVVIVVVAAVVAVALMRRGKGSPPPAPGSPPAT